MLRSKAFLKKRMGEEVGLTPEGLSMICNVIQSPDIKRRALIFHGRFRIIFFQGIRPQMKDCPVFSFFLSGGI